MSRIDCRLATLTDVDQLAHIRAVEWGTPEHWHRRISGYLRGELHPQQALRPRVVFVASEQERIVGFIAGHLTRRFDCDGELEWLNVIPERRRSGIAGELLRALAAWFSAHGARSICVDVDPKNATARAFYRKHGAEDLRPHWLAWRNIAAVTPFRNEAER